jgi:F-type H+-transporting ATPase subunit b
MSAFLIFAQLENGGQIQEIARTFGVDWSHLIAQIISFSILCVLLYGFAYKPILRMLAERRELIAQGLANSERIKAELDKTEAQRREIMAKADVRATQFIEEARGMADRLREQEIRKAQAAAGHIMAQARTAAGQDHAQMLTDLRREVGRLVVQTTAAIAGKVLTAEDQRRLAEEAARQLTTV